MNEERGAGGRLEEFPEDNKYTPHLPIYSIIYWFTKLINSFFGWIIDDFVGMKRERGRPQEFPRANRESSFWISW